MKVFMRSSSTWSRRRGRGHAGRAGRAGRAVHAGHGGHAVHFKYTFCCHTYR